MATLIYAMLCEVHASRHKGGRAVVTFCGIISHFTSLKDDKAAYTYTESRRSISQTISVHCGVAAYMIW